MIDSSEVTSSETSKDLAALRARDTAYSPKQAVEYDERRFVKPWGIRVNDIEFSHLEKALTRVPAGSSTLEVGCGTGRFLLELAKRGFKTGGIDASGAMLEQVKAKLADHDLESELHLAEAAKIPLESNSQDFVYSIRVLNQTESPEYALNVIEEIIRVARPGSYALIEFSNYHRLNVGPKTSPTTRVKPSDAMQRAESSGAKVVSLKGSFFLGMQAFRLPPSFVLPLTTFCDNILSAVFPKYCSRCYLLVQKDKG